MTAPPPAARPPPYGPCNHARCVAVPAVIRHGHPSSITPKEKTMTTSTLFELPPPAALPALCGYCHKPVTGVERIGGMSSIGTVPVANPKFASPPPMPEGVTAGECVDCNGEIVREQLDGWLERQRTLLNSDQVDAWQRHIRSDATH